METFDIQVTISVRATDESKAEELVMTHLKSADIVLGNPDILDWELITFVPDELRGGCCC